MSICRTCQYCNKHYETENDTIKIRKYYCSMECYFEVLKVQLMDLLLKTTCTICHTPLYTKEVLESYSLEELYRYIYRPKKYCSITCMYKSNILPSFRDKF